MDPYAAFLQDAASRAYVAGDLAAAETLLKAALSAGEQIGYQLYLLGHIQQRRGRHADAAAVLVVAATLDPANAALANDLAAALFGLGREAEALGWIRRALDLDPTLAEALETDSIWKLRYGRMREGWRGYEARWDTSIGRPFRRDFPQPLWRGEPIAGRTILLHAEQGFGDSIQFVRYAKLVAARGARVVLELHPGLRRLLPAMPGVELVLERGDPLPAFDLHCPLLSLPLAFGTDLDSVPAEVPYLAVPENLVYRWHTRLGPRHAKRIGLVWSGNPIHGNDAQRSIPLAVFARLLAPHPDRDFHVLQAVVREDDKAVLAGLPHVHDHSGTLRDFADTAALVTLMDLVISVDTSVAHVAGALGWPVWLLLAFMPDWRWMMGREDSPWYPTMWLFRQKMRGDWDAVLAEVAGRLEEMLG